MIYLDNNATSPIHPGVVEAMNSCWRAGPLNAASQHRAGRRAERLLEDAREAIAQILGVRLTGAPADRLIFTSGGTEANNLAIFGLNAAIAGPVAVSSIEHPSISAAADELATRGVTVERIRVAASGVVDESHLSDLLEQSPMRLVSVMLINNETGVIQPVSRLANTCRAVGTPFHTDAIQAVGKIRVRFDELGVDAMSISAHKLHGPVGIGALIVRGGVPLTPMLFGGAQQFGLRAGTEPVALAVGMQRALELWRDELDERQERLARLRNLFENRIVQGWSEAIVVGRDAPRGPHTSNLAFPGIDRQAALIALDMAGIACSTGSACASGSSEPSPVLLAMGCSDAIVRSSLRFSVSTMNTEDEVEEAAARILRVLRTLQARRS